MRTERVRCPSPGEDQACGWAGRHVGGNKGHMAFTLRLVSLSMLLRRRPDRCLHARLTRCRIMSEKGRAALSYCVARDRSGALLRFQTAPQALQKQHLHPRQFRADCSVRWRLQSDVCVKMERCVCAAERRQIAQRLSLVVFHFLSQRWLLLACEGRNKAESHTTCQKMSRSCFAP